MAEPVKKDVETHKVDKPEVSSNEPKKPEETKPKTKSEEVDKPKAGTSTPKGTADNASVSEDIVPNINNGTSKSEADLVEEELQKRRAQRIAEEKEAADREGLTLEEYRSKEDLLDSEYRRELQRTKTAMIVKAYDETYLKTYNFLCKLFGDPRNKNATKPANDRVGVVKGSVQPLSGEMKNVATGVTNSIKNGVQPKPSPTGPQPNTPVAQAKNDGGSAPKSSVPENKASIAPKATTVTTPKVSTPKMGGGMK